MPYAVTFEVEPHEMAGIEWGATLVVGPRAHMVLDNLNSGEITLELRIEESEDVESARVAAEVLYKRIRETARLPEAAAVATGAFRFGETVSEQDPFLDDALDLFDQHRFELCVLSAQITCEVAARTFFERRGEADADGLVISSGKLNQFTLRDPAGMLLFHSITGTRIWDEPWWPNYHAHVTRRNNVAHKGARVTEKEADDSMEAMWSFMEHLNRNETRLDREKEVVQKRTENEIQP